MNLNKIRIGLIGTKGRLGSAIASLVPDQIIASFHRELPADPKAPVDLFLDVSTGQALPHNLQVASLAKKPLVVGTTGHNDLNLLKEAAEHIPIFYSSNFSLGMALMRRAAQDLARHFHSEAHIDLIETHHAYKKDAPSGSALFLAKTVEKVHPSHVTVHSIRSGNIFGEHTLIFNTDEEKLTLTHEVHNTIAFARGALLAAQFLLTKAKGFYGMDDLFLI